MPGVSRRGELHKLLVGMFPRSEELRSFLVRLPEGHSVETRVRDASPDLYASNAVEQLESERLLTDGFFEALAEEKGARWREEVCRVAVLWECRPPASVAPDGPVKLRPAPPPVARVLMVVGLLSLVVVAKIAFWPPVDSPPELGRGLTTIPFLAGGADPAVPVYVCAVSLEGDAAVLLAGRLPGITVDPSAAVRLAITTGPLQTGSGKASAHRSATLMPASTVVSLSSFRHAYEFADREQAQASYTHWTGTLPEDDVVKIRAALEEACSSS